MLLHLNIDHYLKQLVSVQTFFNPFDTFTKISLLFLSRSYETSHRVEIFSEITWSEYKLNFTWADMLL